MKLLQFLLVVAFAAFAWAEAFPEPMPEPEPGLSPTAFAAAVAPRQCRHKRQDMYMAIVDFCNKEGIEVPSHYAKNGKKYGTQ